MKRLLLMTVMGLLTATMMNAQRRVVENLNFGWRFHLGDVQGAEASQYDDAGWRVVDVPHDFQIEQPWVAPAADEKADNTDVAANIKSRLSSRGFADLVLIPRKNVDSPALVLEMKYNQDVNAAISQIKQKNYPAKIQEYTGDILLVGISYDREKKQHSCQIERLVKA